MTPICQFRVTARRVTFDPLRITGSRVKAPNVTIAVDLLLDALHFPMAKQVQVRNDLRLYYQFGHDPATEFFNGTVSEWIEAVRRRIIRKASLTHLVPEAVRFKARKVRAQVPPEVTTRVVATTPRMGFLERWEGAVGRYPKLWTAFLVVITVGLGTWIVSVYWQQILAFGFSLAGIVALFGLGIRWIRGD